MTTKEQERQAIEKIQKIIEGLGADSYLAAAMEGALELAEDNIRDDAMYSWKQRAESAQQKLAAVEHQLEQKEIDLNTAKVDMKEMQEELTERRKECLKLRMRNEDAEDLIEIVRIQRNEAEREADIAAETMANNALAGNADVVKREAEAWMEQKRTADRCKELDTMLQKYMEG